MGNVGEIASHLSSLKSVILFGAGGGRAVSFGGSRMRVRVAVETRRHRGFGT